MREPSHDRRDLMSLACAQDSSFSHGRPTLVLDQDDKAAAASMLADSGTLAQLHALLSMAAELVADVPSSQEKQMFLDGVQDYLLQRNVVARFDSANDMPASGEQLF